MTTTSPLQSFDLPHSKVPCKLHQTLQNPLLIKKNISLFDPSNTSQVPLSFCLAERCCREHCRRKQLYLLPMSLAVTIDSLPNSIPMRLRRNCSPFQSKLPVIMLPACPRFPVQSMLFEIDQNKTEN
jgi:hypothetical protein